MYDRPNYSDVCLDNLKQRKLDFPEVEQETFFFGKGYEYLEMTAGGI
jgi:hypothetical protein